MRTHLKRKEVDDVMGGKEAWANVDKIACKSGPATTTDSRSDTTQRSVPNVTTGKRTFGSFRFGRPTSL